MNRWKGKAKTEAYERVAQSVDDITPSEDAEYRSGFKDGAAWQRDALAAEFRGAFSKNRVMSSETAERIALDIINGNEGAER